MGYVEEIFNKKEMVPEAVHDKLLRLFREHIVVGGMPEVVNKFVETQNFSIVLGVQRRIVEDYLDDIAKYAKGNDKAKAKECFRAIPRNLAKEYKKFQYSIGVSGNVEYLPLYMAVYLYDVD